MRRILAVLLLLAGHGPAAEAGERVVVQASQYPWSAVGRINYGHGWCSGVLLGPRLVATAAHCLWNHATRRPMQPAALRFIAGWDRGDFLAASGVVATEVAPQWRFEAMDHYDAKAAAHDWALLQLDKPVGDQVGWVALGDGQSAGMRVSAIGYGEDRKHVPTADLGCHLLSRLPDGAWLHDCAAVHGDSGGPVLVWRDGYPVLVGINVAALTAIDGRALGGAVGVSDFLAAATARGAARTARIGPLAQPADSGMVSRLKGP